MNKEVPRRRISRRKFIESAVLTAGIATLAYATGRCLVNQEESQRHPIKTPIPAEPTKTPQIW